MGGRSEGNENRWGFMLQIMVWDLKQVLKDTAEDYFFFLHHQPEFTSQVLKRKMFLQETWSSSGFSAWQRCVPSVSYSVSLVFPSYKNSKIFSFAHCLVCLFKNKN